MSVRLRNKSANELELRELRQIVKPKEIAEVPGSVVSDEKDAVVIDHPFAGQRAWPKSIWSLISDDKKPAESGSKEKE